MDNKHWAIPTYAAALKYAKMKRVRPLVCARIAKAWSQRPNPLSHASALSSMNAVFRQSVSQPQRRLPTYFELCG